MSPSRIALGYALVATLWIAFSDAIVSRLHLPSVVMTIKGAGFVFVTALLLYFTIRRLLQTVHRASESLSEQADLLNLTHDTVLVTDLEGVVKYWNRGAEEHYGWTAEEAMGRVLNDLLKTVAQAPLQEIKSELTRAGRWEGELVHTKKDGTQVVVASRWALQHDKKGVPVAVLETNNDITERKQAEAALHRTNRELRAISNCNQVLLRAVDEKSLLAEICRIVCEEADYLGAWVGYAEQDEAKSVRHVAWTGLEEDLLASLDLSWADTDRGRGPCGTAIRTGRTSFIEDFLTDPRGAPWREIALRHGFRSVVALPLKDEQANTFGCLIIYAAQPHAFTPEEIRLLEELAGDLAFGIVTLRSRTARERAEHKVSLLNFALDRVGEAAFLIDEKGYCQYANEGGALTLGYSREELLGLRVSDWDPDFPAEFWSEHWRELKEQQSMTFESRNRAREGRVFPVEVSANYFEYEGRAYNLALVRDISERKQAEEERRENAERFRAIADYTYDWENWIGVDGRLLWVNPAVERITGYSVDECMAMPEFPVPIVAETDRDSLAQQFREAVHGSSRNDFEFRVRHKDGRLVWVAASWQPIYDSEGQRLGHRSSLRDITERKRAEEALRRSEAYLAEAESISHTGSWAWQPAGVIGYWSKECYRIMGFDPAEGVPPLEKFLSGVHPEDLPRVRERLQRVAAEKAEYDAEYRIVRPGGEVRDLRVIGHPVFDSAGNLLEYVGTTTDVTDRKRAEEEVRNTAAQWQATFDAVQDLVLLLDKNFRILRANRAAAEFLGQPFDKIVGRNCFSLIHGTGMPPAQCPLAKMRMSRSHEEMEVLAREGGPWLLVSVDPVFDQNGELIQVVHVVRDITDRKRTEDAMRRSEAYLAEGQRLAHMGSWAWNPVSFQPLYWSEEMSRIYGFNPEDGVPTAEQWWQSIHPEDRDRTRDLLVEAAAGNRDYEHDLRIVLPDGTIKHIHAVGHPVHDEAGKLVEYFGTAMDVTERKLAEDALRRSETNLAEGQKLARMGSWTWDTATHQAQYWSEEMFRIFGLNPQDGVPTPEIFWERIHPEDRDDVLKVFVKVSQQSMDYEHDHRIVLPDGTIKHIHAVGHPLLNAHGQLVEYVGTAMDVTERKRAEEELRKHREHLEDLVEERTEQLAEAKARAEAANRAKSAFLANMSHELRTPLNAVLGFSRLLKNDPEVTEPHQETLDVIVRSGEHLLNLINNVLDMAKIESGRAVLKVSEVDVNRLLHEVQSLMGVGAVEKGLCFSLENDPNLPRFVAVDAGRLRQVLMNLLGNAIKYTDSGGVKLRARLAGIQGTENAQLRFEVEDSGPGISQEDCRRIFIPFVQLGDQAPAKAGTGLGLGICKQYVELMGGQIGVDSVPGKGSVFYFEIPVTILSSVAQRDELKPPRILALAEGQPRHRLLIVEDQPENRLLLRRLLDPLGFALREAANGQEALALFEEWHPDLIWMDIRMPGMDGLEAVRRIRATKAGANTKIIALTAHALEEEREPIMAVGCDDLVRKPFHEQELYGVLARHLRLKFVYEKATHPESTPPPQALDITAEHLGALPAELREGLRQAVIELDTVRTQILIQQAVERDALVGRALSALAARFDYPRLLNLLETERPSRGELS